jgi:recombination protein RecR
MINLLPSPLRRVLEDFERLPGIGQKSAQRIAFYLLHQSPTHAEALSRHIAELHTTIHTCPECGMLTEKSRCSICSESHRDKTVLCVVETPLDVLAIERTGEYNGMYHVLGGTLSPLDNIGPEELNIQKLTDRIKKEKIREVILALNPSTEGEATSLYLKNALENTPVTVTRLAQGLPTGAALEYADNLTITRALTGRQTITE